MAFKPGFDQSPAFNDQGRGAWGAGAGQQQAGWGRTPQQGQYPQQGGMTPEQLQYMYDRPTANPVDTDRMSYEDTIVKTLWRSACSSSAPSPAGTCRPSSGSSARSSASCWRSSTRSRRSRRRPGPGVRVLRGPVRRWHLGSVQRAVGRHRRAGGLRNARRLRRDPAAVLVRQGPGHAEATRFFLIAMVGYLAFSLVNLVLMLTGVTTGRRGSAVSRASCSASRGVS